MARQSNNDADDLRSATVKINEVEWNANRCVLRTSKGATFSFFESKRDGGLTKAAESFDEMGGDEGIIGQTVGVRYKEKPGTKGQMFKTILWFEPVLDGSPLTDKEDRPVAKRTAQRRALVGRTPAEARQAKAELDSEVIGKTACLFLQAAIQSGVSIPKAQSLVSEAVMLAERLINEARGPNRKRTATPEPEEEREEESDAEEAEEPPRKSRAKRSMPDWEESAAEEEAPF